MAEFVRIPATQSAAGALAPLPPQTDPFTGALAEPVACVVDGLRHASLTSGDTLLVLGGGPMGLLHVLVSRAMGAARVIVSEPQPGRREWAEIIGANAIAPQQLSTAVDDQTAGEGVDVAVATIGDPELVATGIALTRPRGSVHLFGGFGSQTGLEAGAQLIQRARRIFHIVSEVAVGFQVEWHVVGNGRTAFCYAAQKERDAVAQCVTEPQFVEHIGVVDGDIRNHHVCGQQALEHLLADIALR